MPIPFFLFRRLTRYPFSAANVLIHQEGRLQLCDFGVATVLDTRTDKRRTFIGTLHWMPPELWTENPEYSDEVSGPPGIVVPLAVDAQFHLPTSN